MEKEKNNSLGLEENIASLLCYVGVWVTGIIFFLLEKKNKTNRFHALQSNINFLPFTILGWVFNWLGTPRWSFSRGFYGGITALYWLSWLVWLVMLILWILLIVKAYQGEKWKLPIIGDIAEKNA